MGALPTPKSSPLSKEPLLIKEKVDALVFKMQKDKHYSPTRGQLEEFAEMILNYIDKYHAKISHHNSYLKAAVIDLTEVPVMAPQMQHVAFLTALKDASHELELFISCL
jgi:hypothetical protein